MHNAMMNSVSIKMCELRGEMGMGKGWQAVRLGEEEKKEIRGEECQSLNSSFFLIILVIWSLSMRTVTVTFNVSRATHTQPLFRISVPMSFRHFPYYENF